jgi:hypothetical protein
LPPAWRDGRERVACRDESSRVPLEQIGQSAVKRLWRQKSEFKGRTPRVATRRIAKMRA